MTSDVNFAVGILGNVASLLLYSAPCITFKRVIKNGSTEDFSGIPYAMTLLNCLLCSWYGTPLISNGYQNILVLTVNGIGVILEIIFISIYLKFAPVKSRSAMVITVAGVMVTFTTIATVSLLAIHDHPHRKILVGTAGMIGTVVMYASPLSIIKLVIQTKSVEFMPFYFSLFAFLNSCAWMTYYLLARDLIMASPNIVGVPLGMAQLVLYCLYRKQPAVDGKKVLDLPDPEIQLKENVNSNNTKRGNADGLP